MAKAALLYADHVTLASPKTIFVASTVAMAYGNRQSQDEVALGLLDQVGGGGFADLYKGLKTKRNRTPEEIRMLAKIEGVLAETSTRMSDQLAPTVDNSQFDELVPAIENGLLEVHPLGTDQMAEADDFIDQLLESLQGLLRSSVSPSASAHPMYDDAAGDLLKAMLHEKDAQDPFFDLANEVGVARDLIDTIEAFPNAPMDVILDVRERLREPLVRFRAAVASASAEIGEEESVLGEHFHARVAEVYRRIVAPELLAIREGLHELRALPTLRRTAVSAAAPVAKGAASTGLALLTGRMDAVDLTVIAAAAGATGKAAADEWSFRAEAARARKENRFFWLYEAERQIPHGRTSC